MPWILRKNEAIVSVKFWWIKQIFIKLQEIVWWNFPQAEMSIVAIGEMYPVLNLSEAKWKCPDDKMPREEYLEGGGRMSQGRNITEPNVPCIKTREAGDKMYRGWKADGPNAKCTCGSPIRNVNVTYHQNVPKCHRAKCPYNEMPREEISRSELSQGRNLPGRNIPCVNHLWTPGKMYLWWNIPREKCTGSETQKVNRNETAEVKCSCALFVWQVS